MQNISKALSLAQSEIGGAKKDSTNPFFKSNYADLSSVMDAIKEPFAKNGLSISQPVTSEIIDGKPNWFVETIIRHSSGEFLSSGRCLISCKDVLDPQKVGSSITYFRRYSLASMCGVAQIDDDVNMATQVKPQLKPQQQRPAQPQQVQQKQADPISNIDQTKNKLTEAKTRLVPNYAPNGTPREIKE